MYWRNGVTLTSAWGFLAVQVVTSRNTENQVQMYMSVTVRVQVQSTGSGSVKTERRGEFVEAKYLQPRNEFQVVHLG